MLRFVAIALLLVCGSAYASEPSIPSSLYTNAEPQQQSTNGPNFSNPPTSQLPPIIKIIPATPLQIEASKKEELRHGYTSAEWWLVYVTGALVLITGALAIFTFGLWSGARADSKRQAKEIRQIERAFVHLDGFNVELATADSNKYMNTESIPEPYKDDPELFIGRLAVQPRWKNGGNTPTRNMRIQVAWRLIEEGDEVDYTYDSDPSNLFISGKGIEASDYLEIPSAQVIIDSAVTGKAEYNKPKIIIWGKADYIDIFEYNHFIKWCYKMRLERHKSGRHLSASFIQWGEYNQSD